MPSPHSAYTSERGFEWVFMKFLLCLLCALVFLFFFGAFVMLSERGEKLHSKRIDTVPLVFSLLREKAFF